MTTFAGPEAPWVGAEDRWRRSLSLPPPVVSGGASDPPRPGQRRGLLQMLTPRFAVRPDSREPDPSVTLPEVTAALPLPDQRQRDSFPLFAGACALAIATALAALVGVWITSEAQLMSHERFMLDAARIKLQASEHPVAARQPHAEQPPAVQKVATATAAVVPQAAESQMSEPLAPPRRRPSPARSAAEPVLPYQLSREQVEASLAAVAPRVARCGTGDGGRIAVRLSVQGQTGQVVDASIASEEHRGTALGACAARAVRDAQFPRFSGETLKIKYPFALN